MTTRVTTLALSVLVLAAFNPASASAASAPQAFPDYRSMDLNDRGYQEEDFPRVTEIADGVYIYEGLMSNEGQHWRFTINNLFVVTAEGVLLGDARGSPEATQRLVDAVAEVTDQPIRYLVVGSDHTTHMGGNSALPQDITVFAHPTSAGVMQDRANAPDANADAELLPTELVSDKKVLQLGGKEIHILHLGRARSGGDLLVYLPEDKIIYTTQIFPAAVFPAISPGFPTEWLEVIDKLQAMDVDFYIPGHGFIDSPEYLERELEMQEQAHKTVMAVTKRLYDAGVPVDRAVEQARFGELENWTMRAQQAPSAVRRIYQELNGELPPKPRN